MDSTTEISPKYVAQVYNEQGIIGGKLSRHPPTIIREGSKGLKGKANARNTLTQAMILGRSNYQKKIDNGYSTDATVKKKKTDRYYAMAAHRYDDKKSKVTYPCHSQPKLDGVRCIMTQEGSSIAKYSRDLNNWHGYDHWDKLLMPIFSKWKGLHLDGELYLHGKKLQEITGVARNEVKAFDLEYHVFDAFIPNSATTFPDRMKLLNEIPFPLVSSGKHIIRVPTIDIKNENELDIAYNNYIAAGYEGQMVRLTCPYETSQNRELRSNCLLKRKKRFDAEFQLIDVMKAEKGRAKGTFIGLFAAPSGKHFKASPKDMTMDEMSQLYVDVSSNIDKFIGKLATIEYEDISKDQVPLRPKFLRFRDSA